MCFIKGILDFCLGNYVTATSILKESETVPF
jgi:hypothetical protein